MKQIPMKILTHSCILRIYSETDIYGDRELISDTEIKNVRIVPKCTRHLGTYSERLSHGGRLYYDCKNSQPADIDFLPTGCRAAIFFDDREYTIFMVRKIFDKSGVHHLEVHFSD